MLKQTIWMAGVLATLTAVPGLVSAHCGTCGMGEAKTQAAPAADPMAAMAKELNLSEDQKAKIKSIKEEKHRAIEKTHQDARGKILKVLSKDQQAKFETMAPAGKMGCAQGCSACQGCASCQKSSHDGHAH